MPGPALSETFTYNGTPHSRKGDKFNTLSREMIQTLRFFTSKDTGTHARVTLKKNIPRNSNEGQGGGNDQHNTSNIVVN